MENFLNTAITIGPIALLLGLLTALVCCLIYIFRRGVERDISLLRYVFIVIAVGIAAYIAGTVIGIAAFCSTGSAGNLCGLGGVFGIGPLLCGICIAGYSYFWLRGVRKPV